MANGISNIFTEKIFSAPASDREAGSANPKALLFSPTITKGEADAALGHITGKFVEQQTQTSRAAVVNKSGDDEKPQEKTVVDFYKKVLQEQPFDAESLAKKKVSVVLNAKKPAAKMTVADYNMAKDRAFFKEAGYAMLTDEEVRMAVSAIKAHGAVNHGGETLDQLRQMDNKPGWMFVKTDKATIEYAKRAAQAVLQYQSYKAGELEAAIEKGRNYATDALGGFIQPIVNAPVNIFNGITEPFRAGERVSFGTGYIPEIPRMRVAERSEYWNKDGRMVINRGAEIGTTILLGGAAGGKAVGTQAGRIFLGTESAYNIGAGVFGRDVTQRDAQGNARQMPWYERGLRVTGGVFGARQTINTEIATPTSITNRAAEKLDDVFKNTPTFKPQGEFVTPQGFRIKAPVNQSELDGIEKGGNIFEMRAKKTLSGVAPEEQVVNALKTEFKPVDYKFGNNTIKLSRAGMKHILERHHPEFWSGTVKDKQSYFAAKTTIEELQNVITIVLKQNRETLAGRGAVRMFQVKGNVNGVEYTLGIERGQVKQLYTPQK